MTNLSDDKSVCCSNIETCIVTGLVVVVVIVTFLIPAHFRAKNFGSFLWGATLWWTMAQRDLGYSEQVGGTHPPCGVIKNRNFRHGVLGF